MKSSGRCSYGWGERLQQVSVVVGGGTSITTRYLYMAFNVLR